MLEVNNRDILWCVKLLGFVRIPQQVLCTRLLNKQTSSSNINFLCGITLAEWVCGWV